MRKTLVIIGVLALAAAPLFGQWHSDFRVTNTSRNSYTPYSGGWGIAADASDVHIAWYDYTFSARARYHTFPIGSPSLTSSGEQVSSGYAYTPVVAIHDGEVFESWYYYSYPYYLHTREKNGSWGSIIDHGVSYSSSYYPATATDEDGDLHCVFNRYYSGYRVYYQRKNSGSGSFTSPVQVYNPGRYRYAYYPSICVTSDGVIHVSVGNSNGYRLVHAWSDDNGASWNTENLTGTYQCYPYYATSICCDSDDNLYIAYISYNTPRQAYVISGTTGSWSSPVQVSQSTYRYVYYPSICSDVYDNVWVCWDDRSGQTYEIYYNKLDAESGSWDGPSPLTVDDDEYSRRGQFSADENGNVHISWYDRRDGNYEIYYNWYEGDTTGGGGGGERDLACTRIIEPVGPVEAQPYTPEAVMANFGDDVDSGYAICRIDGPGSSYDEGNLEGPIELDAGEEDNVTFPAWTPPGQPGDQYTVSVTVYLWPEQTTEDDDPTNNTDQEICYLESAVQVDAVTVSVPEEGGTCDCMNPEAEYESTGSETAEGFYLYCDIAAVGYHTEPYTDSFSVASLAPGEKVSHQFAEWVCDDSLPYEACFYAAVPGGEGRELLGDEIFVGFQGEPFSGVGEEADALRIELIGPNPFISGTTLSYSVPSAGTVSVRVYDVTGKMVRTLHQGLLTGSGTLYWNGCDEAGRSLGSGLYFVRISTSEFTRTTKVIKVR